jgi:hypothetical protein
MFWTINRGLSGLKYVYDNSNSSNTTRDKEQERPQKKRTKEQKTYRIPRCQPIKRLPRNCRVHRLSHRLLPSVDVSRAYHHLGLWVGHDQFGGHQRTGDVARDIESVEELVIVGARIVLACVQVARLQSFSLQGIQVWHFIHHAAVEGPVLEDFKCHANRCS